jgi:hypothetical protein
MPVVLKNIGHLRNLIFSTYATNFPDPTTKGSSKVKIQVEAERHYLGVGECIEYLAFSPRSKPLQCTECTDVLGLAKIIAAGLVEVEPGGYASCTGTLNRMSCIITPRGEDRLTVYASDDIAGTFRPTTSDTYQKLAEVYREEHDGAPVPFSSLLASEARNRIRTIVTLPKRKTFLNTSKPAHVGTADAGSPGMERIAAQD